MENTYRTSIEWNLEENEAWKIYHFDNNMFRIFLWKYNKSTETLEGKSFDFELEIYNSGNTSLAQSMQEFSQ